MTKGDLYEYWGSNVKTNQGIGRGDCTSYGTGG